RNVWSVVTKMFADAQSSKTAALRVRSDNPAAGVAGPDRGVTRSKTYLYPGEFLALVSCPRVPLAWRRLCAFPTYPYLRAGELEALGPEDVDVERALIHVHRAVDRSRNGVKGTKSQLARRVPIEPALLPLARTLRQEARGPRFLRMPSAE